MLILIVCWQSHIIINFDCILGVHTSTRWTSLSTDPFHAINPESSVSYIRLGARALALIIFRDVLHDLQKR